MNQSTKAAGAGNRTWRAYLSTQASALSDPKAVHARDRIGAGPWYNAKGVMIAKSVEDLHSANNLTKQTALDEKGELVNGRTETPNKHDILTGSRPDGTAFPPTPFPDMTCGNWTKSGSDGSAMLGHHDRGGPVEHAWAISWNSSHPQDFARPIQFHLRKAGEQLDDRGSSFVGHASAAKVIVLLYR